MVGRQQIHHCQEPSIWLFSPRDISSGEHWSRSTGCHDFFVCAIDERITVCPVRPAACALGLQGPPTKRESPTGLKNDPLTVLLHGIVLDDGGIPAQDHIHGLHPARRSKRGKRLVYIGSISFERADH